MLTLAQASSYFDRMQVYDAYTGAPIFLGQVDPYDDSRRDAGAAYRRVLSVAPSVQVPAHRCVRFFGQAWILGETSVDGLDEQHRAKYVAQQADALFAVGSMDSFLRGHSPTPTWGSPNWVTDSKQVEESSDVANLFEMLLPIGTATSPRQVLWTQGSAYLALSVRDIPSQFVGVNCLKLETSTPGEVLFHTRTYSAAAGDYVEGPQAFTYGIRVRWQSLFKYDAQIEARYQEGDFSLVMPSDTVMDTSASLAFEGQKLSVLSLDRRSDMVVAHVRSA